MRSPLDTHALEQLGIDSLMGIVGGLVAIYLIPLRRFRSQANSPRYGEVLEPLADQRTRPMDGASGVVVGVEREGIQR